jgi:putative PIN family toxin of toxin-antitoxin system
MIRVVLDTNIIVSALLQPLGPPAQVFQLALGGVLQVCVTGAIYTEYEEVIRRPRFQRSEETISAALLAIREQGHWVRPSTTVRACTDPDDDIFLECAEAAEASFLITGNLKHFPPSWGKTES